MRAGVVWANTFNRFDPTSPFGGYKESGFGREGGLHGPRAVPGVRRGLAMSAQRPGPAHRQALHRRRVPAERVRTLVRGVLARRAGPSARVARASRKDLRDAVVRRVRAQPGWSGKTAYNRAPDPLPGRRADGGPARAVRVGARRRRRERPGARRERVDRPVGLVRGLGGQDRAGRSAARTRSPGPYFNFTIPEPTGVVGHRRAAGPVAARARVAARPGDRERATRRS